MFAVAKNKTIRKKNVVRRIVFFLLNKKAEIIIKGKTINTPVKLPRSFICGNPKRLILALMLGAMAEK